MDSNRVSPVRQGRSASSCTCPTPAECRHTNASFDMAFHVIGRRRDLSPIAKDLYGALISMLRLGQRWTQTQLAEHIGMAKRQTIWRATSELIAAGLLRMKRIGLCLPNAYELVETDGLTREDLNGRAKRDSGPRTGHPGDRSKNVPAGARPFNSIKEKRKNINYTKQDFSAEKYTSGPYSRHAKH